VWTLDGIVVTDMAATGASPTYFNFDNFEEIQVSTAGQDIKQPTGGMGLNFVVKRGTNQFTAGCAAYYDSEGMESNNVPAELAAAGRHARDVGSQQGESPTMVSISVVRSLRDKAWFYGSYSIQDIRLVRRAGP